MFFTIQKKPNLTASQQFSDVLLNAYYIIDIFPLRASEVPLDNFLQQQYKITLKNACINLLLGLRYYDNGSNELVLLFKNPKDDQLARLITYGNGVLPGSKILQIALNS